MTDWQAGYDEGRRMGTKTALGERDQLKAEVEALRAQVARLESKITKMSKYILRGRDHKRAYIKALKWYMANTNFGPDVIPEGVYITLRAIAMRMMEKAKRAAQEVTS